MDTEAFSEFLKRGGRSPSATQRAVEYTRQFEEYLETHGKDLDGADPSDLESFVAAVESEPGASAKLYLWGLHYYYEFIDDPIMAHHAAVLRRERVEQTPFKLRDFRGVDMAVTDHLARCDIRSVDDLRRAGVSARQRADLAARAGIPLEPLEELVRLADLSRIGGLKSIRARLYLDAGVGSVADLATRDPDQLVDHLRRFVHETDFDGIAPLPGETRNAVATARELPALIEW